ncbi:MAG: putative RNA methyltransferase [Tenericutes bacterium ADurb.Bin087]|nr:MAG: putative RNA methyltransferase [Tenericutes bacterium ADurb.Bin087]
MIKENDIFIVTGADYTSEGIGLAKVNDFPIFINNLIIGEEAEIKITKVMRNFATGKIIRFTKKSSDRITPLISETIHLAGCQFTQLDYAKEVEYKLSKVERALRVIGGISFKIEKIHAAKNPYFYRNKTVLPFGKRKNGKIYTGLFRHNTHEIIAMEKTHLDDELTSTVIAEIRKLIEKYNYEIYDEISHTGQIRKVMVRVSYYLREVMVVLITKDEQISNLDAFCRDLVMVCPNVTTIIQNVNSERTNVILGKKEKVLYGHGVINEELHDLKFTLSSKSFFQVNTLQAEVLYERALTIAGITKNDVVLDAYSGTGTIALLAAQKAKQVIGVEIVKDAVKDAEVNAKHNNITNVKFFKDDAGAFLTREIKNYNFSVVIVDPPRKGLSDEFINTLLKTLPPKIMYVSCDPATLARDLKKLTRKYNIEHIECVDMFPRTAHVETIVGLILKK